MNIYGFKLGSKVEIEILSNDNKVMKTYNSFLIEIESMTKILLASPMIQNNFIYLRKGIRLRIVLFHKGSIYGFLGTTINNIRTDNQNTVYIEIKSEIEKIQRRGYFRLKCLLDTDFLTLDPTQLEKEILDEEFHKCVTKNISGSGICLSTEEYIDEGQIVKLSVTLDEDTFIQPTSQIVRIESIDLGKDKVFNFGCEFIKITEAERNLIIRFVYEQQRRLLKKDIK